MTVILTGPTLMIKSLAPSNLLSSALQSVSLAWLNCFWMLLGKCHPTIAHVFLVQEPFDTEFYPIDHICKSASRPSCNLLCSDHWIHKPTSRQSPIYKYRRRSNKEERLTRKQNCLLNSCWQAEIMSAATANKSTSIDSCVRGWTSAPEWRRYLLAWEPSATEF